MPTRSILTDYETLLIDRKGGVATITMNRPEQKNAWDWLMHRELGHVYATLDADDDIRAIVLTGAGKAFCAGAMLAPKGATFDGSADTHGNDKRIKGPSFRPDQLLTPVVAAINGAAVGAGITMALSCDIRVVAADAKIGFVFNRRGVIADGDLLWFLPKLIGYGRAMDLLLTGRMIDGREAVEMGLASRAVPAQDVLATAQAIAADISENVAPVSAAITKLLAKQLLEESDRSGALLRQWELFCWAGQSLDAREGVDAFLEKRPPVWRLSKNNDTPEAVRSGR